MLCIFLSPTGIFLTAKATLCQFILPTGISQHEIYNLLLLHSLPPHQTFTPFILGIQGLQRGLAGGSEGVQWALALRTPSEPPRNPQATLRQPPMKYIRMMEKKRGIDPV